MTKPRIVLLSALPLACIASGVKVQVCVACANSYGVSDRLGGMGIEVKAMGKPLTDLIQSGWKVLTF